MGQYVLPRLQPLRSRRLLDEVLDRHSHGLGVIVNGSIAIRKRNRWPATQAWHSGTAVVEPRLQQVCAVDVLVDRHTEASEGAQLLDVFASPLIPDLILVISLVPSLVPSSSPLCALTVHEVELV